jgi:hypothetical protein
LHFYKKKDRKFIVKELETLMELVEKLPAKRELLSLRERDFLKVMGFLGDYSYWLLYLLK